MLRLLVVVLLLSSLGAALSRNPLHPYGVRVRLVDAVTGRPLRTMVCLQEARTGAARGLPAGRVVARAATADEFAAGFVVGKDVRGWVGPILPMTADTRVGRSANYAAGPSIPFWDVPYASPVDPEFVVSLPAGEWTLRVSRGTESIPAMLSFSTPGTEEIEVRLERWIDLAREGWLPGDVHVHHPTRTAEEQEFLLRYSEATDLRIVSTLAMGHHGGVDFPQGGFGEAARAGREGTWIVPGQEEPRLDVGHLLGLNLRALVRDIDHYDRLDRAVAAIRAQPGALAGFAHLPLEEETLGSALAWLLPTTGIDFAEGLQFGRLGAEEYYRSLDLGFQFGLAAGSDMPWGSTMGEVRTYARVTDPRSGPDAWFAALRAGRTFVTNGPALDLTVDGAGPGDHLRVARGQRVTVRARARSHPAIGVPRLLQIMARGQTYQSLENPADSADLSHESELRVDASQWVAARVVCDRGAVAHTSALYLEVNGEPTWSPDRIPSALASMRRKLDRLPQAPDLLAPARARYEAIERHHSAVR